MTNKIVLSLLGSAALAATSFAGTAPSGKACNTCTPAAAAAEQDLGLTLAVGYDTNYIFRGLNLADDWFTTSLAYSLALTESVDLNLDAAYGNTYDSLFSFERLELGAGLSTDVGGATLGLNYRNYQNLGAGELVFNDANEVGLSLGTKLGPIDLGVSANRDFTNDGWFFAAGASTNIAIAESVSLVPSVSTGYGIDYNYALGGSGINGFSHVNVGLALPIKLSSRATLRPYIAYNMPVDEFDGLEEDLFGGVSLSVKF